MPIKALTARQIFDSKGIPTVEVDLTTELGLFRAAVSSAAGEGIQTVVELRDGFKGHYHGKSVTKAIENIKSIIAPELLNANIDVTDQKRIDDLLLELDGTENRSNLGANAILGVSLAVAKAGAAKRGVPLYRHIADLAGNKDIILPVPAFNVLNGGSPAGNNLAIREFLILPTGAKTFAEAMKMGSEVYHHLKNALNKKFGLKGTTVGDEGGFAPNINDAKKALQFINTAIKTAKYDGRVVIGLDIAASEFCKQGKYDLNFKKKKSNPKTFLTSDKLKGVLNGYLKKFPIVSIEDPFDKSDWKSWIDFTKANQLQIVGDDLTASNPKLVEEAIEKDACNGVLLKINQIGTVTEAIDLQKKVKSEGWGTMVSHLDGETEDTFIADLVVGLSTGQIKTGAPCRSDRLAKYNQILRIEEELGEASKYAGEAFRRPS